MEFKEYMKSRGFSNQKKVWLKETSDSIIALRLRKSSFSDRVLIDLGVYFFIDTQKFDFEHCQLTCSLDAITDNQFNWSSQVFESFPEEIEKVFSDIVLPELEKISNIEYLKVHFPGDFDHDKWWLAYIRESDFINYLNTR